MITYVKFVVWLFEKSWRWARRFYDAERQAAVDENITEVKRTIREWEAERNA